MCRAVIKLPYVESIGRLLACSAVCVVMRGFVSKSHVEEWHVVRLIERKYDSLTFQMVPVSY